MPSIWGRSPSWSLAVSLVTKPSSPSDGGRFLRHHMPFTEQVGGVCGDIIAVSLRRCPWAFHWPVVSLLPWGEGLQVSRRSPTCPHTGHLWERPQSVPRKGSVASQHLPILVELGCEEAEEREARTRLLLFLCLLLPTHSHPHM